MASARGSSRIGTMFGPYEIRSLIGAGGMGEVYQAYDTVKDRTVAVKLLRPEFATDQGFQARFRRESRLAAQLQEPHVIPVHDWGEINSVLYIDMRFVKGSSVAAVLEKQGPLGPARATSIVAQVASALDAAHAAGLVHRDVKPDNILLTDSDFAYPRRLRDRPRRQRNRTYQRRLRHRVLRIHGAGAFHRRTGWTSGRCLLACLRSLRVPDRAEAIPTGGRDADDGRAPDEATAATIRHATRAEPRIRWCDRTRYGEATRAAV